MHNYSRLLAAGLCVNIIGQFYIIYKIIIAKIVVMQNTWHNQVGKIQLGLLGAAYGKIRHLRFTSLVEAADRNATHCKRGSPGGEDLRLIFIKKYALEL
jgi:hypothetical protein